MQTLEHHQCQLETNPHMHRQPVQLMQDRCDVVARWCKRQDPGRSVLDTLQLLQLLLL